MVCNNENETPGVNRQFDVQHQNSVQNSSSKTSRKVSRSNDGRSSSNEASDGGTCSRLERKKARERNGRTSRSRARRLPRERQIPLTSIHCTQLPAAQFRLRGKLRWLFEHESELLSSFSFDVAHAGLMENPSKREKPAGDNQPNYGNVGDNCNAVATESLLENQVAYRECSGGEGDVSEMGDDEGLDVYELLKSREEPSSSSSDEGPFVRTAAGECVGFSDFSEDDLTEASSEKEDKGPEDWRFEAEVLMADCNLLRIEKELALRRWKRGCVEMDQAVCVAQALRAAVQSLPKIGSRADNGSSNNMERSQDSMQDDVKALQENNSKMLEDNLNCSETAAITKNGFALETLKRLDKLRNSSRKCIEMSKCEKCPENPAEALQNRLENLLLAVHSHTPSSEHGALVWDLPVDDPWNASRFSEGVISSIANSNLLQASNSIDSASTMSAGDRKCRKETAALRKQLDFLSLELRETQKVAALIRREYRSLLSQGPKCDGRAAQRHWSVQQDLEEEMDRKAAIQEIAAQVQAETEQWSQVQNILYDVQKEMETLHYTGDMWEKRALHAEAQLVALQESVHEWRLRARAAEEEITTLQSEVQQLRSEVENEKHPHTLEKGRWIDTESRSKNALHTSTVEKCVHTDICEGGDSAAIKTVLGRDLQKEGQMNTWAKSEFAGFHCDDNESRNNEGHPNKKIDFLQTFEGNALCISKIRQKYYTFIEPERDLDEHRFSSNEKLVQHSSSLGKNKNKVWNSSKENRPHIQKGSESVALEGGHAHSHVGDQERMGKSTILANEPKDPLHMKCSNTPIRMPFGEISSPTIPNSTTVSG